MKTLVNTANDDEIRAFFNLPNTPIYRKDWSIIRDGSIEGDFFINIHGSNCGVVTYHNGRLYWHNESGPAAIEYGYERTTIFYRNIDKGVHRPFAPAKIAYFSNGCVAREEHYLNGKLHNLAGPAVRGRVNIKSRWVNSYYVSGKSYSFNDFFKKRERLLC